MSTRVFRPSAEAALRGAASRVAKEANRYASRATAAVQTLQEIRAPGLLRASKADLDAAFAGALIGATGVDLATGDVYIKRAGALDWGFVTLNLANLGGAGTVQLALDENGVITPFFFRDGEFVTGVVLKAANGTLDVFRPDDEHGFVKATKIRGPDGTITLRYA